ncbi:MAG TPA: 30S ribosomal protein S6 [Verrucomicrobiae bacterium]|nr:30S ribosomal protein S6 [Verrucomicrobiae bacterium]
MRMYETIYIVQPDLADEDQKALSAKVQEIITGMNGEVRKLEDWGVRKLAYIVKKSSRGRYMYLRFDGGADLVAELERRLRIDDRILRYQTVKLEKEPAAPKVVEPAAEEAAAEAPVEAAAEPAAESAE